MATKQLQNNFTTPEQSKCLLELGVPADSANAILRHYIWAKGHNEDDEENWETPMVVDHRCQLSASQLLGIVIDDEYDKALPCWSVGRLIEIFIICTPYVEIRLRQRLIIEQLIASYEDVKKQGLIDFSKLEESNER